MILIEPTNMGIANLNLILLRFENMLGHKINFGKREVIVAGTTTLEQIRMANFLNCKLWKFPITYLGLLVSEKSLRASDWDFLTGKVGHMVDPWRAYSWPQQGSLNLRALASLA
jgi:hypothetical protein